MEWWTDRLMNWQTDGHMNWRTERPREWQSDGVMDWCTSGLADRGADAWPACSTKAVPADPHSRERDVRRMKGFLPAVSWGSKALPTHWFQTSHLHNCQRINFCCFKLSTLWPFVTVALGNLYIFDWKAWLENSFPVTHSFWKWNTNTAKNI